MRSLAARRLHAAALGFLYLKPFKIATLARVVAAAIALPS